MVLLAFVGELGSGKTLGLTFLAYKNFLRGKKIYSNYKLFDPPFKNVKYVKSLEDLENMHDGFFSGDELWLWCDSRMSASKKNRFISAILIKSRKREIHIGFTAQNISQIDRRIRGVLDFIVTPILSKDERMCRLLVMTYPSYNLVKIYKFLTEPVFDMYNTKEEIEVLP